MHLYTFIMIEPAKVASPESGAGESVVLVMGGFPKAETDIVWREDHIRRISQVVQAWTENTPAQATALHRKQRDVVLRQVQQGDFSFKFEFHTGEEINLGCFMDDTDKLHDILVEVCKDTDMVASKYSSI